MQSLRQWCYTSLSQHQCHMDGLSHLAPQATVHIHMHRLTLLRQLIKRQGSWRITAIRRYASRSSQFYDPCGAASMPESRSGVRSLWDPIASWRCSRLKNALTAHSASGPLRVTLHRSPRSFDCVLSLRSDVVVIAILWIEMSSRAHSPMHRPAGPIPVD